MASDVGVGQLYLPSDAYQTQSNLNQIAKWSVENLVKLNEQKCNYMIFSRSKEPFLTRLTINNCKLDQIPATKLLGVWITEDLSWQKNTQEICRKAYARLSMLTKLKYVGVSTEDLIDIYILYIRILITS